MIRYIPLWIFLLFTGYSVSAQKKLSLKDAIRMAKENNPFLTAEKYNIDISKADVTTAELKINPEGSIGLQQLTAPKYFPDNSGFFSSDNRQISYQVSKSFQVKNQRALKIKSANADLGITQTNLADFERNLSGSVSEQWLDVWNAARKLEILQLAKVNSDTLLKINANRLKNQVITQSDFARTEIVSEQYQLQLLGAQQELTSALNALELTTGTKETIDIDQNDITQLFAFPVTTDSLFQLAVQNRSDLLAARQSLEKSKTDLLLQKALAAPQPNVGLGYSRQNKIPYWGISFSIPLPFYDRNQGEIARANATISKNESMETAFLKQIASEVRTAYQEYQTNKATFEKFASINQKSENVLKTVRFSYLKGGTTILDYLDAERTWFDTRNQYYDALYQYQKSILQLLLVTNLISSI